MPKCLQTRAADTVLQAICPEDAQPMVRHPQSMERSNTLDRSTEVEEIELSMTWNRNQTNTNYQEVIILIL